MDMDEDLQIGDLVEWLETIYPKVHRMNRGIIIKAGHDHSMNGRYIYKVMTTDNEAAWVFKDDLRKLEDE